MPDFNDGPGAPRYTPEHVEDHGDANGVLEFIARHKPGDLVKFRKIGRGYVYLKVISAKEYNKA